MFVTLSLSKCAWNKVFDYHDGYRDRLTILTPVL